MDNEQIKKYLKENERAEDLQNGYFAIQSTDGYNFNSDSVALSKFAVFKRGGVVIDLCSGSGVLGFLLASDEKFRKIKKLINVELQRAAFDRSVRATE
jgi:tRNA1(Val) A37 N6-methylase TrmN6